MASITHSVTKPDGTASTGWFEFEPVHPIVDATGAVRVPKAPMRVSLTAGVLTTTLQPCSGTGIGPANNAYIVRSYLDGVRQPVWLLDVTDAMTTLDLSAVPQAALDPRVRDVAVAAFEALEARVAAAEGPKWRWSFIENFGHSYAYLIDANRYQRWQHRSGDQLGIPVHNHAQSSSELLDYGVAQGGWTRLADTVRRSRPDGYNTQRRPIPPGLPIGMWGINDLNEHGSDAQWDDFIWAYELALRSMHSLNSLAVWFPHNLASTGQSTPTGSWATGNSMSQVIPPSYSYSSAAAAKRQIVTGANDAGSVLSAIVYAERIGASLACDELIVTLDGSEVLPIGHDARVDTREIIPATTTAGAMLPVALRVELPADDASHTITIEAANNLGFMYGGYGHECARPQIWANVARILDAGYSVDGDGDAKVALMNAVHDRVAAEFAYAYVLDIDAVLNKTAANFGDNIHPNVSSMGDIHDALVELIEDIPATRAMARYF